MLRSLFYWFSRIIHAIFILIIAVYTKPLVHRVILQLSKKYGPVIQFYFGKFSLVLNIINQTIIFNNHVPSVYFMPLSLLFAHRTYPNCLSKQLWGCDRSLGEEKGRLAHCQLIPCGDVTFYIATPPPPPTSILQQVTRSMACFGLVLPYLYFLHLLSFSL